MGKRRFEVYQQLAQNAVKRYNVRMEKLQRTNRLRRSGSQLSMLPQASNINASQENLTHIGA